jgi:THO complex subunit 4
VNALCKLYLNLSKLTTNSLCSQPKSQPKSAVTTKTGAAATAGAGAGRGRGRGRGAARGGRNPRPAKKTAEELDSEMADYFENGSAPATTEAAATTATAQPAAAGDAMDDEVLVSHAYFRQSEVDTNSDVQ